MFYVHLNHTGTPETITNEFQEIVWQSDYSPFGTVHITTEGVGNPIRFPGQRADEEAGLIYNYFRD